MTLVGILPPAAVAHFLLSGRVGVCPLTVGVDSVSDRFTSPLKLLQMMSLGMPIVASDVAPVRALVNDGEEALLTPAGDPRRWWRRSRGCSTTRTKNAAARCHGTERAKGFTWSERAGGLEKLLSPWRKRGARE